VFLIFNSFLASKTPWRFKLFPANALLICNILCACLLSSKANAAIYVYIAPDGSNLISDTKINKAGYQLKRSYKTKPYRSGGRNAPYLAKPITSQYDLLYNMIWSHHL